MRIRRKEEKEVRDELIRQRGEKRKSRLIEELLTPWPSSSSAKKEELEEEPIDIAPSYDFSAADTLCHFVAGPFSAPPSDPWAGTPVSAALTRPACRNEYCTYLCHTDHVEMNGYCCKKCAEWERMSYKRSGKVHGEKCEKEPQVPPVAEVSHIATGYLEVE